MKLIAYIFLFCLSATQALSQNIKREKFGNILQADFEQNNNNLNKDVAAIVISSVGSSEYEGNANGNFSIVYKIHKKILIKKNSAFDLATIKILVREYSAAYEDKIDELEAATYNIVNGKIVATKLNKDGIVKEKLTRNIYVKKFTLPEVKENCIIEYKYTILSPFQEELRGWKFQEDCPVLWSEYYVSIPPMFNWVTLKKGNFNYKFIDSGYTKFKTYTIIDNSNAFGKSEMLDISGDARCHLWVMKNVPAFEMQSFIANPSDVLTSLEFELHSIKYSANNIKQKIKSWYMAADELQKATDFGQVFNYDKNEWIEEEVKAIADTTTGINAAKKMYNYFVKNFACTGYRHIFLNDDAKKIFKQKKGSAAEINLLLTSFLFNKGFIAEPVILSTRGNGKPTEASAILGQYDYLICRVKIDSEYVFLDASDSKIGFGKIPLICYNGFARVINNMPVLVDLSANKVAEEKNIVVFISNSDAKKLEASYISNMGYTESLSLRNNLTTTTKNDYFKQLKKCYGFEITMENTEVENEKNYDENATVKYDFSFNFGDEDIIYFNPMLCEATKENMFKVEKRLYPVELPHTINETYTLDMEVPKGYVVDELPKSIKNKLNDGEGYFEYLIVNKDGHIQLRCRFQLKTANFEIEDYDLLREFYGTMIKKQAEQIVFKKINK